MDNKNIENLDVNTNDVNNNVNNNAENLNQQQVPTQQVEVKSETNQKLEVLSDESMQVKQDVVQNTNMQVPSVDNQTASNDNKDIQLSPEKGGPSNFKRFLAVLFFIVLFSMIWFMPEINKFIQQYRNSKMPKNVITTGTSICKLSKTTEQFDIEITASFSIVNSKLTKLTYVTNTKGDQTEDHDDLEKIYENCLNLKKEAGELDGVIVSCNSSRGNISNKQILDYEKLDKKKVTSAYTEAGGVYPEFEYGQNIDKIESKMKESGYSCSRT